MLVLQAAKLCGQAENAIRHFQCVERRDLLSVQQCAGPPEVKICPLDGLFENLLVQQVSLQAVVELTNLEEQRVCCGPVSGTLRFHLLGGCANGILQTESSEKRLLKADGQIGGPVGTCGDLERRPTRNGEREFELCHFRDVIVRGRSGKERQPVRLLDCQISFRRFNLLAGFFQFEAVLCRQIPQTRQVELLRKARWTESQERQKCHSEQGPRAGPQIHSEPSSTKVPCVTGGFSPFQKRSTISLLRILRKSSDRTSS